MIIEKSGFLLMAGTLAAGGVGGWLAHDSKVKSDRAQYAEPPTTAIAVTTAAPPASAVDVTVAANVPTPPICDDSMGTPEECPAMGPADEGVCTNFAAKRCAEFKTAFKPKVAQAAVSCLKTLKGNAACDPARVNLCGHAALMSACPESETVKVAAVGDTAPIAQPSPVATACENIMKSCASTPLGPTLADCKQTLSGMTEFGRASMVECMATHCADKGLIGCEGVKKL